MTPCLVVVRNEDGTELSQGTGWFLRPGLLVTTLHVVGKVQPRGWAHDVPGQARVSYSMLGAVQHPLALTPACFDAASDIALLSCDDKVEDAVDVRLAEAIAPGDEWYADGYPGFDEGNEWTLSGRIVKFRGDRLQLLVSQGTKISWAGVSGSALRIGRRVAGLITAETTGTNTAWAAAAPAIARLAATYDAATAAREILGDEFSWTTDRDTLVKTLEGYAKAGDPQLAELLKKVEALAEHGPSWTVPEPVLEELKGYGIGPLQEGFRPLVCHDVSETNSVLYDPWDEFALFFEDAYRPERFGGRINELAELDAFVESSDGGYFFVTGPAGFGKTALLAEWLRCLRARGERPAFYFITGKPTKYLPKPYTESACLRYLCAQLLDIYRLGGDLPRETDRLGTLYKRLLALQPPPQERIIVILDGLDEALRDWTPGHGMFPRLPKGVHLIFSARPVANRNWLKDLRLQLDDDHVCNLDRLERAEVQEVLSRSGLSEASTDPLALLDVVVSVTNGDPDYVADVIELLDEGAEIDAIRKLPEHHSKYLQDWWESAYDDLREFGSAFEDLMGMLSVLREPLPAADIAGLSDADDLSKANVVTLIKRADRYLNGDPKTGYKLGRTRILDLVADRLEDKVPKYRVRVAEFCRNWSAPQVSETARQYSLRNGVAHLLQIRFQDAIDLLGPDWLAAKWLADGSYVGLLDDLDRLVTVVASEVRVTTENRDESGDVIAEKIELGDWEKLCRLPALGTARETARELMASLPTPVLQAEVRLGGAARVIAVADTLPEFRGEATKQLLAVSEELLLRSKRKADVNPELESVF